MPVRYIGREATYKGKFLFHLLCNLRGFGVGRMVVRRSFNERYPEPSYYIINKAFPDLTSPDFKAGYVIAKQVFRGKCLGEERKIKSGYKPDWDLIPKEEEVKYLSNESVYEPVEVPVTVDMPPLLTKLYTDKLKKLDIEPKPEDTKLFLRINRGAHNRANQPHVQEVAEAIPAEERIQPLTWREKQVMKSKIRRGVPV